MVPRISQVQIQGYKSIERAVVDLEPFTAFVGPNGAGKSNFLDALAFVQDCLSQSLEQALEARGGAGGVLSRFRENGQSRSLGIRLLIELSEDRHAEYSFEISPESHAHIARERCVIRSGERKEWIFDVVDGQFVTPIPGIRAQIGQGRFALYAASATDEYRPLYDFLTSLRIYNIEPKKLRTIHDLHLVDYLHRDGSNAAAVLKSLKEAHPLRYQRVRELLAVALPDLEDVDSYTLFPGPGGGLKFQLNVGMTEPITFFEGEVSDGTLRILGLLLAAYQPQRPSVLGIEEPELTVHPALAELISQVLLDSAHDGQVLVTTHSPDVLDAKEISDDQIRIVTMDHGRTLIAPLATGSRKAIRERLYTPGELLRINELDQDLDTARETAQHSA
jgi:predicted ATPase